MVSCPRPSEGPLSDSISINSSVTCVDIDSGSRLSDGEFSVNKTATNSNACEIDPITNRIKGKFISQNVVNLSSREMSEAEVSLLSKGLKFVPTPTGISRAKLKEELEVFGRRLRLGWHFRNSDNAFIANPFRPKSTFNPKGKDAAIEIYLSRLEEEILSLDTKLQYNNLTREERQALRNLQNDHSIVIKEADKGSGVVIWDREDYLKEAHSQLSDENVYQKLEGDITTPLVNKILHCISRVKDRGDISSETIDYFLINNPRVGRFYLLPKIHKRLDGVPGRPVISNCGYHTENISSFLDYHLQPLAKSVKSYIKDTNDFLKKLRDLPPLPEDAMLCTIDVVGLYPNIPHNEGLEAIKNALNTRQDQTISTESLVNLAECVLKNNVFEFDGHFFKQKRGTAIGTKMAPPYAILFMAELEQKLLQSSELTPLVWWRYIDDIFVIWQHGEDSLKAFIEHLNSSHPSIKFTAEYSYNSVNFLDVNVIKHGTKLATDLFVKPTDTHQYLQASSCHVYHSKRSIPYSQALRLNRICSEVSFFDKRCNQLETWLIERGYNDKLVRDQILKARKHKRDDLLDKQKIKADPKLTLNITYHPAYANLKDHLKKIHILLAHDKEHSKVFPSPPIVGFKRGKSLKDFLVRAKLPEIKQPGKCRGCGNTLCQICKGFLTSTSSFHNASGDKTFEIKHGLDLHCNSTIVIYLIQCKTCHKQYVGSTKPRFRLRFNNYHKNWVWLIDGTHKVFQRSFHEHFAQEDHNGDQDWEFILIDQCETLKELRRKEAFWQYKLDTFIPKGLNDRDVPVFYG